MKVWDIATRTVRAELRPGDQDPDQGSAVGTVVYSPDGNTLATAHGAAFLGVGYANSEVGRIRLWDVASGKHLAVFEGHKKGAHTVAFAPDGKLLASVSGELEPFGKGKSSELILWDINSPKPLLTLDHSRTGFVRRVVFSADSRLLAIDSQDGVVSILDVATKAIRTQLRGHTGAITQMQFTGDNQTLATASNDKTARLWDISLGPQSPTFGEPGEPIASAAFSPDGASVVLALTNGTVVLADARTFTESRRFSNNSVALEGGAFSPDGKWFAGYGAGTRNSSGRLKTAWHENSSSPARAGSRRSGSMPPRII